MPIFRFIRIYLSLSQNFQPDETDYLFTRWEGDTPYIFLKKLNDFYTASAFDRFFKDNAALYQEVAERYNREYVNTDFKWFDLYFGEKPGDKSFKVILNLLEKGWNFGAKVRYADRNKETAYAMVGMSDTDSTGMPVFDDCSYQVVIHELIHSYTNPLVDKYSSSLDSVNLLFYGYNANRLRQFYVGKADLFLYETMVRACEIQYHKDHSLPEVWRKRLCSEMVSGFLWLDTLCTLMTDEYEHNRENYPDPDSFMPRIAEVLNALSPDRLSNEFLSRTVKVTGFSIPNGDTKVDPATTNLTISFDKQMLTGRDRYGFWPDKYGEESFPKITQAAWIPDARQLVLDIRLEPGKAYPLLVPERFFLGSGYEPFAGTFHLEFSTAR